MDSKIKIFTLLACTICAFLLSSCKQDSWVDWKFQNELWLARNKSQPGVQTTASGLQYRVIADPTPTDARPNPTSTIICDYTLKLINGTVIESKQGKGFYLGSTIPGFTEGCHKIHNNGDIELYIPASLGYDYDTTDGLGHGTEGYSAHIPPYSTLIFTIHICSVNGN